MGNCIDFKHDINCGTRKKRILPQRIDSVSSWDSPKVELVDFKKKGIIGEGINSKVFLVEKLDSGHHYAMKVMTCTRKLKWDSNDMRKERVILEKLRHPFIVTLKYAFQKGPKLHLVVELANGGDLYRHLQNSGKLPEDHWRFYAAEILSGLNYLHNNKVIYRGLKPEDVLLDKYGHVKLSDFELAKSCDKISTTFWGEPYYMAPEVIKGESQSYEVDWWSFGILIYEMLVGEPPFRGKDLKDTLKTICDHNIMLPNDMSKHAQSLITNLLCPNPELRLGHGEKGVKDIQEHPFFKNLNWEEVENRGLPAPYIPNIGSDSEVWYIEANDITQSRHEKLHQTMRGRHSEANESNFYFNVSPSFNWLSVIMPSKTFLIVRPTQRWRIDKHLETCWITNNFNIWVSLNRPLLIFTVYDNSHH